MKVDDLVKKVADYRRGLKKNTGRPVKFTTAGPVSMGIIEAMVSLLQEQEKRIAALENKRV